MKNKQRSYASKYIKLRHAEVNDVVVLKDHDEENPVYFIVLNSYFEQVYLDLYKDNEKEILRHGTNYIDAMNMNGYICRLQYYEYIILRNSKKIQKKFFEKYPMINGDKEYVYHIHHNIMNGYYNTLEVFRDEQN